MATQPHHPFLPCTLLLLIICCSSGINVSATNFSIEEATVAELQAAFKQNILNSTTLVEYYLSQILSLNGKIRGIIEVNPDVLLLAQLADEERKAGTPNSGTRLHGIPILLKDNMGTKDKLNTTAGSFALLGSVVPSDSGVAAKLRAAGAIIMGKAALSEWAHYRGGAPSGWSGRGGQALNPYVMSADPRGSSTGSAVSVASNMVAVALGTETDGSIIGPSYANSVVGIKPTLGLTSRAGVVPISARQDTVGPICRTVSDAAYVLDAIAGYDPYDTATAAASEFIPPGGYVQFLNASGLKGKRLGIVRNPFFNFPNGSYMAQAFQKHFQTLSQNGATLVDNLEIANISMILNSSLSGEAIAMSTEFKITLNTYLSELVASPIRTLADAIAFNLNYSTLEMIPQYGQSLFLAAEYTTGTSNPVYQAALARMLSLTENGFVKLMTDYNLDALITANDTVTPMLAIGGFPGISVPAGYAPNGAPFGICFNGLQGYEPRLIEIAYAFEQATKIRKPPSFLV
ncbi:probable amidase At4g34880 [Macadamia integrifolia]|uniref:probable amidase At4g34880 n=1 Tax=Macadamia integrifolia TaxID=60698 RepID=UPI001C4E5B1B|nr:probable amidase At4g34880 [Macadamia integrifolia]